MKEKIAELKARLSMAWHAMTSEDVYTAWLEGDEVFYGHVTHPERWNGMYNINFDE